MSFLKLENGTSYLLLENGTSKIHIGTPLDTGSGAEGTIALVVNGTGDSTGHGTEGTSFIAITSAGDSGTASEVVTGRSFSPAPESAVGLDFVYGDEPIKRMGFTTLDRMTSRGPRAKWARSRYP